MLLPLAASLNLMMIQKLLLNDPWLKREGDHLRALDDDDHILVDDDDDNVLDLSSLG